MKKPTQSLTAKARPLPALTDNRLDAQSAALAKWLTYCMDEKLDLCKVTLSEEETKRVVGFRAGAYSKGEFMLPSPTRSGTYRLSKLIRAIQSVRPRVWSAAVERAGGIEWRRFAMGLQARRTA